MTSAIICLNTTWPLHNLCYMTCATWPTLCPQSQQGRDPLLPPAPAPRGCWPGDCSTGQQVSHSQGGKIWYPNWVRLAPNGTNLGLFKISFITLHFGWESTTGFKDVLLTTKVFTGVLTWRNNSRAYTFFIDLSFPSVQAPNRDFPISLTIYKAMQTSIQVSCFVLDLGLKDCIDKVEIICINRMKKYLRCICVSQTAINIEPKKELQQVPFLLHEDL